MTCLHLRLQLETWCGALEKHVVLYIWHFAPQLVLGAPALCVELQDLVCCCKSSLAYALLLLRNNAALPLSLADLCLLAGDFPEPFSPQLLCADQH